MGCCLGFSLAVAAFLTWICWWFLNWRIGAELMGGDEREYVRTAWLSSEFGVLLMTIEAVFEFRSPQCFGIEFVFEDLLLGVSALCMLAEEVRLLKAAVNVAKILKVGHGFDRIVTPPPHQAD